MSVNQPPFVLSLSKGSAELVEAPSLRSGEGFDFMSPWEGAEYILPGDEKAKGEAPGAPTPAPPPTSTPKTTEKKADTGAGEAANKAAKAKSEEAPAKPAAQTDEGKGAAKPEDKA